MIRKMFIFFGDESEVFDKVWPKGLLYKLHKLKIRENLLKWFKSCLNKRSQRVNITGQHSSRHNRHT